MPYIRRYFSHDGINEFELPVRIKYSFKKIFDYWEELAKSEDPGESVRAREVLKKMEGAPELHKPFEDPSIIEKYEEEMKLLLSPLFPPMTTLNEIKAACMPFVPMMFNATQRLHNILDDAGGSENVKMRTFTADMMYIGACIFVLNFKYQANLNYKRPMFFNIMNQKTGIERHYRTFFNADFSSFTPNDNHIPLNEEDIKELRDNFGNVALWKEKIPPNSFDYEGFSLMTLLDVTMEEAISEVKDDLLKPRALYETEVAERIRKNMSIALEIPDLRVGFTAFEEERGLLKPITGGLMKGLVIQNETKAFNETYCQYSSKMIFKDHQTFTGSFVPEKYDGDNPLLHRLIDQKIRSYMAAPLIHDDEVIGILELASGKPYQLNSVIANKFAGILPIFPVALKRALDDHETSIDSVIQKQFTTIHPAVEWRFIEAAEDLLVNQKEVEEIDKIEFVNVHPLYGQTDISGSSTARNQSIMLDSVKQLKNARKVLRMASKENAMPIYGQLEFRITEFINRLSKGLQAGDEVEVQEFLRRDIYPVFNHLDTRNDVLHDAVEAYLKSLDTKLGVVYNKRKDYEDSVSLINQTISSYLDHAQEVAQEMFPHYFEKYKTDGVEHNMYIGQSLVNGRSYDELYLHNLRLWQLMLICEVENILHRQRPKLKVPLKVASLILAHHNPISIKFDMDEKQFDVEGAYNIRYEIIKKRIDKALIRGTTERLTQPGKIAIVYTQDSEAREYANYLQYLQSINYIGSDIEWVELNDMQGVTGLKAIRVVVTFDEKLSTGANGKSFELVEAKTK